MIKKLKTLKQLLSRKSSLKSKNFDTAILRYPAHIAIIMDGNGRWAAKQNLPRLLGHKAGMEALKRIVEYCVELPIDTLTVFAFSTENWKRPDKEISGLMGLLEQYLIQETKNLVANGVKLNFLGDLTAFDSKLQHKIYRSMEETKSNKKLLLNVALNYGGRADIVNAVKSCAQAVQSGILKLEDIDETYFATQLATNQVSDPDLLIRTSAEMRVSNFLLWEIAYSEIWVTPVFWPDFNEEHLLEAITWFSGRDRRFGGIKSQS
jgi:undecaprenyl diphosphate synthase